MVREYRHLHACDSTVRLEIHPSLGLAHNHVKEFHCLLFSFKKIVKPDPMVLHILRSDYAIDSLAVDSSEYHVVSSIKCICKNNLNNPTSFPGSRP